MESFDFTRMTALSFERLVRAFSFQLFGPPGIVYSSGPDGARDFTIEGKIRGYESKGWTGYLVLQVKFCEKPLGKDNDISWLENQLQGELVKYTDEAAGLKRPDYYIIASNISLSGSDGNAGKGKRRTGGYTKIANVFKKWQNDINLKDFDIWPAAKIVDLLISFPEVRQAYAAWVTPGDVLTAVLSQFQNSNIDFKKIINRSLMQAIRRDQYARLRDAGSVIDDPVRVSQVFIDLPLVYEEHADKTSLKNLVNFKPVTFVNMLVERAKERFDADPNEENYLEQFKTTRPQNKIVIMGGPGQGKSTASMFLAQFFRASLLNFDRSAMVDTNVKSLIPEILARAKSEGVSANVVSRYPVFVSLPRFADAISQAKENQKKLPSLLIFIADEISETSDSDLTRDDLRKWLAAYPWIIILDGLDEVPPSGERQSVVNAIAAFQTEVIDQKADVLTLVTTRPQGYNNDLDKLHWEHWILQELPAERAIAYATALGEIRYPLDSYRREEILKAVSSATQKQATARLMISPLQVTIMYLIVDTGGSVPVARWNLFNEYFEILKKRERAKGSTNQKILELNWSHLGPIHQRAGLVLQTDSEHVGGALSYLDADRFKLMLYSFLETEGFNHDDLHHRVSELIKLALQRLVLLCSREEGRISFDVRSLQEFMAASALTSGSDIDVENRLAHISALSHWRHTFLIAVSRCFADDKLHHLRSRMVALPRVLDSIVVEELAYSGPILSLEMLVDGIGSDQPKSRRLLAQHALELLAAGVDEYDDRISQIIDEQTVDIFKATLIKGVNSGGLNPRHLSSWRLLLSLAKKFPEKFLPIAEQNFPEAPSAVVEILSATTHPLPNTFLIKKSFDAILRCSAKEFSESILLFRKRFKRHNKLANFGAGSYASLDFFSETENGLLSIGLLASEGRSVANLKVVSITGFPSKFTSILPSHSSWKYLKAVSIFSKAPSKSTLIDIFVLIQSAEDYEEIRKLDVYVPWPVATIFKSLDNYLDLPRVVGEIAAGDFGDLVIWQDIESRWVANGFTLADLLKFGNAGLEISSFENIGLPYFSRYGVSTDKTKCLEIIKILLPIVQQYTNSVNSVLISDVTQFIAIGAEGVVDAIDFASSRDFLVFIDPLECNLSAHFLPLLSKKIWENSECLKLISRISDRIIYYSENKVSLDALQIVSAFNFDPSNRGLLNLLTIIIESNESEGKGLTLLDKSGLIWQESDSNIIQVSVFLLAELAQENYDLSQAISVFSSIDSSKAKSTFLALADRNEFWGENRQFILSSILTNLGENSSPLAGKLRQLLRKTIDSTRSSLPEYNTWHSELNLPYDAYLGLKKI